jgi:hypothetical protein
MKHHPHLIPAAVAHVDAHNEVGMQIKSPHVARNAVWILALTLVAYYALFRLPFLFPPRQRLMSASYAFGFNNSVAILAMAGLLGIVTLLYVVRRGQALELRVLFSSERPIKQIRPIRAAFAIGAVGYAILTFAMYIYNVLAAPPLMWETRHLLHRTWLMDLYGLRPYSEVAAEYGPILTYAPSLLYRLLRPLGASHDLAYFAAHLLLNLAGLWCVYYVLSRANMPSRARIAAFAVLAIAGFGPWMGVNGVLARYLFPFGALLLGHRVVSSALSRNSYVLLIAAAVVVLLLLIANVLLSPEIGIAFAVAWLGYAMLSVRTDVRILAISVIAFVAAALFCWFFLPVAYYGTLLRFSEGANNLPLLPAPHLLLYMLTLFLVVPPLLAAGARGLWTTGVRDAAICGAFGILCVVMSPGALGRCDPPHILLYGMGAAMLLMIRLANISWRAFGIYLIAYAGVSILFLETVNLIVFYGVSPTTIISRHPLANLAQNLSEASSATQINRDVASALDRYPRLALPYASFGPPAVEKYVVTSGKLDPEYYVGTVGVYSAEAVDRKLRDVGKAEYLLVPGFLWLQSGPPNPCGGYLKNLRQWFLYPARLPCRADPLDPLATVKSFISDHYMPVEQIGSWWVLRRISGRSMVESPRTLAVAP